MDLLHPSQEQGLASLHWSLLKKIRRNIKARSPPHEGKQVTAPAQEGKQVTTPAQEGKQVTAPAVKILLETPL